MINVDPRQRVFVLNGTGFSYALWCPEHVDVHDQPVPDPLLHLHWGAPISLADALALADACLPPRRGFDSPLDGSEEYPPSGVLRFGRAALDVDADWRYAGHDLAGDHLTLKFASGELALGLHYRVSGSALERRDNRRR